MLYISLFFFSASCTFLLSHISFNFSKHKSNQIQNIHSSDIPRTGGLALIFPLIFVVLNIQYSNDYGERMVLQLFFLALCIFLVGLIDDLCFHVRPRTRLILVGILSALACFLLGGLSRLNLSLIDNLLDDSVFAIYFVTAIATAGLVNSFNMIDGLNGLCSGVAILALLTIGMVSVNYEQPDMAEFVFILVAVSSGFWAMNTFFGNIFLGDSGAYFLGFLVSQICIFLNSNIESVSSWCYLLICIYPFWEMLFSISRRFISGGGLASPDRKHLHHILYDYFRYHLELGETVSRYVSMFVCLAITASTCLVAFKFKEEDVALKLFCVTCFILLTLSYLFLAGYCRRSRHSNQDRNSI